MIALTCWVVWCAIGDAGLAANQFDMPAPVINLENVSVRAGLTNAEAAFVRNRSYRNTVVVLVSNFGAVWMTKQAVCTLREVGWGERYLVVATDAKTQAALEAEDIVSLYHPGRVMPHRRWLVHSTRCNTTFSHLHPHPHTASCAGFFQGAVAEDHLFFADIGAPEPDAADGAHVHVREGGGDGDGDGDGDGEGEGEGGEGEGGEGEGEAEGGAAPRYGRSERGEGGWRALGELKLKLADPMAAQAAQAAQAAHAAQRQSWMQLMLGRQVSRAQPAGKTPVYH
jgi:hypothetical protein